jgi:Arc/MetJ family transcription regulator
VYESEFYTHGPAMRTNIEIDEKLMAEAMKALGTKTKRETVQKALEAQVAIKRQLGMLKLKGKVEWIGDLDDWRRE